MRGRRTRASGSASPSTAALAGPAHGAALPSCRSMSPGSPAATRGPKISCPTARCGCPACRAAASLALRSSSGTCRCWCRCGSMGPARRTAARPAPAGCPVPRLPGQAGRRWSSRSTGGRSPSRRRRTWRSHRSCHRCRRRRPSGKRCSGGSTSRPHAPWRLSRGSESSGSAASSARAESPPTRPRELPKLPGPRRRRGAADESRRRRRRRRRRRGGGPG
mmetsp:Transcript_87722/g.272648  ORF Transcript_87722/g.272648 Transcript_87722/m.272648 type:complete len:220 (+) Transcript_87722:1493-2152(+)